jgi:hypothetical protein
MGKRGGRHPDKALTAIQVRQLKTPGRYADGNGLYLVVDPSGAKRWLLRIMVRGKRCDIGLGGVSLVSLAEAREIAAQHRKIARQGGDPLAEKRAARKVVPTFKQAAQTVHDERKPALSKRSTSISGSRRSKPTPTPSLAIWRLIRSTHRRCSRCCRQSG